MNYAEIKEYDVANGPGVRLTLFVSGCTHHCDGCFNKETWDFDFGQPYTQEIEDHLIELLDEEAYQGLTLLGGEPMEPANQKALLPLLKRVKSTYPKKDIWCFTGYLFDRDLQGNHAPATDDTPAFLSLIDVLVDGEFVLAEKDITLLFKGSRNQRTIDVQRSLTKGEIVMWDPAHVSMSPNAKI